MALHAYEEESPYPVQEHPPLPPPPIGHELETVKSHPTKRLRWATVRGTGVQAKRKRQSIMNRFHKRDQSDATAASGGSTHEGTDAGDAAEGGDALGGRTVYFGLPLPPSARDEEGHPKMQYPRNKIRTAKYTPLSFIPKNLWFQFHNIANIFFLFILILQIFPLFGATNPGLSSVPLIVILVITAIKDAIEDTRRTILDSELNNSPVHLLVDYNNVNTSEDKISLWRKFKKANSRAVLLIWHLLKRTKSKNAKTEDGPVKAYAERAAGTRPSIDSRRMSTVSGRMSEDLGNEQNGMEMTPVPSPFSQEKRERRGPAFGQNGYLAPPENPFLSDEEIDGQVRETKNTHPSDPPALKRFYGSVIDPFKESLGKARFKKDYWKSVRVGDFVRLYNDEEIPADILILNTSDPDGACYIETRNLDGETNLKVRQALHCGQKIKRARDCERTEFWVDSEAPHANLYSYSGAARWNQRDAKNPNAPPRPMTEPVNINNLLLRGCSIRNTEWVLGVVIFTGADSKIMLNSGLTPSKRAKISRDLNWNVLFNFVILFFMCLVAALVEGFAFGNPNSSFAYFEYGSYGGSGAMNGFITFWAALVLFQNLVPISLYISLEIIRTFQAYFIYSDLAMYYAPVDYPCTPKSWNISDDLGQIEYVFSDKTGTLTQNVMEFKKATINGVAYGEAYTEALAGMQKRQGIDTEAEGAKAREQIARDRVRMLQGLRQMHDNPYLQDEELTFVAPALVDDLQGKSGEAQRRANEEFMLALALCHTVITERTPGEPPRIEFKAQSPDEAALVATARDCGFTVLGRSHDGIIVNVLGENITYTVLNTLEFNSSRKRMSAIIRMPDGRIVLYCKGADSIIYSRLKSGEQRELRQSTADHLEMFAREGLRTLCIASRELSEDYYQQWNREHDIAAAAVDNRDEKLEKVSDAIERELTLLGGTAIEDRLQDGVPDAIALLANAGIKLWVLTGDKVETAINIGFSCNLLNNDMDMILIKIEDDNLAAAEAELDKHLRSFGMTGSDEELVAARKNHEAPAATHALVIDGDSLKLVLDESLRQRFLLLCKQCKSVLCCRVSPAQKAAVVRMVKLGLDVMTLSIGDGANDVAMIQEADVGVGIAGVEGRAAVMAADYALGQFRFLARLMLVHGRWCYRRLAESISNFFYKNIVWTFALFWYSIYDNYDCTYVFDYSYIILFNLIFTSLPPILLGILDQDVNDRVSLAVPQLYRRGIERKEWTQLKFWTYMFDGLYQSVICYFLPYLLYMPANFVSENGLGLDDTRQFGVVIATPTIIVVNTYILMNTYNWDVIMWPVTVVSILTMFAWTGIYTSFTASFQFYKAAAEVFGTLSYWAVVLLTTAVCLLPRFASKAIQKVFLPYDVDIIREQDILGQFDYLEKQSPDYLLGPHKPLSITSSDASPAKPVGSDIPHEDHEGYQSINYDTTTEPPPNEPSVTEPKRFSMSKLIPRKRSTAAQGSSLHRMRQSMDRIRPSYEGTRGDLTTSQGLMRVESSNSAMPPRHMATVPEFR